MLNPGKWINGRTPIDPLSGKIMENPTFWLNKQSPALFFFAIHLHVSINLFIQTLEGRKVPKIQKLDGHHLSWLRSCELYLSTCLFLVIFPYFSWNWKFKPMPQTLATSPQENSPACSGTSTTVCTGAGRDWTSTSLGALAVLSNIHGTHPGCVWNSGI